MRAVRRELPERVVVLLLVGQQAELIDAGSADIVHDLHHGAKLGAGVSFNENPLIHLLARRSFTLLVSWSRGSLSLPKKTLPVAHNGDQQGIFLVGIRHCSGLFTFAMSTLTPCCNMGVITMKMISNTSITSTMGVTLMLELTFCLRFALRLP